MTEGIQNPEHKYTECYVAFLDILGFSQLVKCSEKNADILSSLIKAVNAAATLSPTTCETNEGLWITQIRAFSDSVAMFIPAETHALSDILFKVRYLHDRLFELGRCLRGAVTVGRMYWNDDWTYGQTSKKSTPGETVLFDRNALPDASITIGPAFVEAYELERTAAVYPRVIFSPSLMTHIDKMSRTPPENSAQGIHKAASAGFLCSPTPKKHGRCILDFIRIDSDGVPFLDLFHRDINRNDPERIIQTTYHDGHILTTWTRGEVTFEQFMRNMREMLKQFLEEQNPEKVRAKHLWLANYFNTSLDQHNIEPLPVEWVQFREKKSST